MLPKKEIIALGSIVLMALTLPDLAALAAMPEPSVMMEDGAPAPDKTDPKMGLTIVNFDAIDRDANGQISKDEFGKMGMTESLFTTIDTDRDGYLSRTEVDAHGPLMTPVE